VTRAPTSRPAGSTGFVSVAFTALFARLASLPTDVGLAMCPRFITLPIAVPIVELLGGNLGLAGMGTIIQVPPRPAS
jgi:putative effector of murein hydrolase